MWTRKRLAAGLRIFTCNKASVSAANNDSEPLNVAETLDCCPLHSWRAVWGISPAAAAHRPNFFGQGPRARSRMPRPGGTEKLQGGPSCNPLMAFGAIVGNPGGWNGSIWLMQSIGKTPGEQVDCIVMLGKLPGCHVRETCVPVAPWKPVDTAGGHMVAECAIPCGCLGSLRANPCPPMAVVAGEGLGQCSRTLVRCGVRNLDIDLTRGARL